MTRSNPDAKRGFARHFEGWEPGLLAVLVAGSVALLVVPRPAEPQGLPDPEFNPRALARVAAEDRRRAREAERSPLDADVRALGDAMRAYGMATREGEPQRLFEARRDVAKAAARAMAVDPRQTLELRAWETEAFLAGVHELAETGEENEDLRGLGGDFVVTIDRNGWAEDDGEARPPRRRAGETAGPRKRRILMSESALRAFYKKRWNEMTGVKGGTFELEPDERRALSAFLLLHPVGGGPLANESPAARSARFVHVAQFRLKLVDEIAALDPEYPRQLARGIIFYQGGRFPAAAEAFRDELAAHPTGPWALRAQNHLSAALTRAMNE